MKKPKPASLTSALLARLGEARRGAAPGPPPAEEDERLGASDEASPERPGFGARAPEMSDDDPDEPASGIAEHDAREAGGAGEASARVSLSEWIERPRLDEDERQEPITARFRRPAELPGPGIGRARIILVIVAFAVIGAALGFLFPHGEETDDALTLSAESVPEQALLPGPQDMPPAMDRSVAVAPLPPAAPRPRAEARESEIAATESRPSAMAEAPKPAAPAALAGAYAVQLLSARSEALAAEEWGNLAETHAALFAGLAHEIVRAEIPGRGTYYRLRVGGYAAADEAQALCAALKAKGTDCLVVRR